MEEIRCLLWLVMIFGAGNPRIWKALHRYHSPQKAVEILRKPETDADLHLPEHTLRRIRQTGEDKVDEMLERCEKLRLSILWYGDAAYPEQLLSIVNPPVLLFYQGDSSLLQNHLLLTIVGTRNPAEYSLRVEKTICHDLVQMGFVPVTGFYSGFGRCRHDRCGSRRHIDTDKAGSNDFCLLRWSGYDCSSRRY